MPKFEKGSAEAKAWGEKMKAAREAKKKSTKVIEKPVPKKSKGKISGRGRDPSKEKPEEEKSVYTAPPATPFPNVDEIRNLAIQLLTEAIQIYHNYHNLQWDERTQEVNHQITQMYLWRLQQISAHLRHIGYEEDADDVDNIIIQEIEHDWESDEEEQPIGAVQEVEERFRQMFGDRRDTSGGKLKNPFKKMEKGLWKAQDVMSQANPFSNKGFRQAGVKTGDVTNRQLLPATTELGMPLLYATAGTAGMMTGGPVGSLAAIRGTQMLYDEMVTSKGYDPRDRQQDAILKAISSEAGKQGASELKSSASVPKGKGIIRGRGEQISKLLDFFRPSEEEIKRQIRMEYIGSLRMIAANIIHWTNYPPEEKYRQLEILRSEVPNTGYPDLDRRLRQETITIVNQFMEAAFPNGPLPYFTEDAKSIYNDRRLG